GVFISRVSQADADARADTLACANATLICSGKPLFTNAAQTCAGGCASYPVSAGTVLSIVSQEDADHGAGGAFEIACDDTYTLCHGTGLIYYNTAQTCTHACIDGVGALTR